MDALKAIGFWGPPNPALLAGSTAEQLPKPVLEQLRLHWKANVDALLAGRPAFPDPGTLVERLGSKRYDERVHFYVSTAHRIRPQCGFAICRCCGISSPEMGSAELSDGEWVWPEGLVHYLRIHQVPLPDSFLKSIETNESIVPEPSIMLWAPYDFGEWRAWTAAVLGPKG